MSNKDQQPDPEDTTPSGSDGDEADAYRGYVDKNGMSGPSSGKNGHKK